MCGPASGWTVMSVGAGLGEGVEKGIDRRDHQMDVERLGRVRAQRLHHRRADRDVGHEMPVHHIDMDPVGAGRVDRAHFLAQPREIGGEDRGRDADGLAWRASSRLARAASALDARAAQPRDEEAVAARPRRRACRAGCAAMPSGCGGDAGGQFVRRGPGRARNRVRAARKRRDLLLALRRFERAGRVDQRPARLHPVGGAREQLRLQLGHLGDRSTGGRGGARRDGGGRCRSRCTARRAAPRRRARRAASRAASAVTTSAVRPVRARFSRSRARRLSRDVDRGDVPARRGELQRLAAGRGAQIEHACPPPGRRAAARGARRRDPAPTSRPRRSRGSSGTGARAGRRTWPGSRLTPPSVRASRRSRRVGERQVERRRRGDRARGGLDAIRRPRRRASGSRPDRAASAARAASRRARISVPNTPWTSLRGPPSTSGSTVAIAACGGVPSASAWTSAMRSANRALASSGRRALGRRIDQRVEIGQAAQRLGGDGMREAAVVGRGDRRASRGRAPPRAPGRGAAPHRAAAARARRAGRADRAAWPFAAR